MITEAEIAYLAGLIDGEGSIGIYVVSRNSPSRKDKQPIIQPVVQLKMCDPEPIMLLQKHFASGQKLFLTKNKWSKLSKHPRPYWVLILTFRKAYAFCKAIYPYLRIESKKIKASKIIFYYESGLAASRKGYKEGGGIHTSIKEVFEKLEQS